MSPIVNSQEAKRFSVSRAQMLPIVNQTRAKSPREWLLPRVPKCPVWKRCEWPALLNSSVSRSREQVHFIISGEDDETDVRALADDQRPILQRGAINCFIMSVPRCLGQLNYLRIWHDNSGEGKNASWYLKHVVVKDIITGYKYEFIAERWFAVEEGDGLVRDFCESSFMNDEIRELHRSPGPSGGERADDRILPSLPQRLPAQSHRQPPVAVRVHEAPQEPVHATAAPLLLPGHPLPLHAHLGHVVRDDPGAAESGGLQVRAAVAESGTGGSHSKRDIRHKVVLIHLLGFLADSLHFQPINFGVSFAGRTVPTAPTGNPIP
ncbi:hypothetical protein AVEN_257225-2 [Araneus ventricosus]|uniref:PLAT domain-containing protein n=1 Tax=Araneus ventricosus TaxID=182803 RepID=A0A4Y2TAY1_ARAVE|nr:hypothetical protein AVEN_257225-2 [Araneus ventricosus]